MSFERSDSAKTAEERIGAAARELLVRMWRDAGDRQAYPAVPDYADFADELRPFIQREIRRAQLETARKFGTLHYAAELLGQISQLDALIAERRPRVPIPEKRPNVESIVHS